MHPHCRQTLPIADGNFAVGVAYTMTYANLSGNDWLPFHAMYILQPIAMQEVSKVEHASNNEPTAQRLNYAEP